MPRLEGEILYLTPDEKRGDWYCPACGREWRSTEWTVEARLGDAWAGSTRYRCPDCEEDSVVVQY